MTLGQIFAQVQVLICPAPVDRRGTWHYMDNLWIRETRNTACTK